MAWVKLTVTQPWFRYGLSPIGLEPMIIRVTDTYSRVHASMIASKVHRTNMGPIGGRQDPGGPHVGPVNFVIWEPKNIFWCDIHFCPIFQDLEVLLTVISGIQIRLINAVCYIWPRSALPIRVWLRKMSLRQCRYEALCLIYIWGLLCLMRVYQG